jgi:uncharacterized hydrophobic protein (TIGR00271 family)
MSSPRDHSPIDTPASTLFGRLREREDWTDEERHAVLDDLFPSDHRAIHYVKRFAALIVLSTMIAAFGLISGSAAVVIGAMLVAPLMTPMLALAASLIYTETKRFVGSVLMIILGTATAVFVAWLVASISVSSLTAGDLQDEILVRTSPSLLDLGIAVAAGLAAGYVLTHKGSGSSLPGVAIAVALVPPLATAGITLRLGDGGLATGAMLLYVTNLIAIVLSAAVVMMLSGFVSDEIREIRKGKLGISLLPWAVALVVVAVPLAIHTNAVIEEEAFAREVAAAIVDWDPQATVLKINTEFAEPRSAVDVTVATLGDGRPAWELARRIAVVTGLAVDVEIQFQTARTDAASTS